MNHAFDVKAICLALVLIPEIFSNFFNKSFIVLHFTCKSMIHFELNFIQHVRLGLRFCGDFLFCFLVFVFIFCLFCFVCLWIPNYSSIICWKYYHYLSSIKFLSYSYQNQLIILVQGYFLSLVSSVDLWSLYLHCLEYWTGLYLYQIPPTWSFSKLF